MNLARPLQRALNLVPPADALPAGSHKRRQHARVPLDLLATCHRPDGGEARGRVRNLSDGGLLLEASESLPPGTHLRLQLHTHQGVRTFEGEVLWHDAAPHRDQPPVAHGVRFTGPGVRGLAVDVSIGESQSPPPSGSW
jgi:hypothetical protein